MSESITIMIDGVVRDFSEQEHHVPPPEIINHRTFIPLRGVFQALGFEFTYTQVNPGVPFTPLRITFTNERTNMSLTLTTGEPYFLLVRPGANTNHMLDEVPFINRNVTPNRTMVPLRGLLEAAGYGVGWREVPSRTVLIRTIHDSYTAITNDLNIREIHRDDDPNRYERISARDDHSPSIGQVNTGDLLQVIWPRNVFFNAGENAGQGRWWVKVKTPNNLEGWVAMEHIRPVNDNGGGDDGGGTTPPRPPKPLLALTFDDGPDRRSGAANVTDRILNVLRDNNAKATFFVLGYRVIAEQDIVRNMRAIECEVAVHAWDHLTNFNNMANDQDIVNSVQRTFDEIQRVTGAPPHRIVRPPGGMANERVRNILRGMNFSIVNWTSALNPQDYRNRDPNFINNFLMNEDLIEERKNGIVLLHDIHPTTADAMVELIPWLAERYELVTVSELFRRRGIVLQPGTVYTSGR